MNQRKSKGWVVVVFEGEQKQFDGEVAYVVGPFDHYEDARSWADTCEADNDGECQLTFIEEPEVAA